MPNNWKTLTTVASIPIGANGDTIEISLAQPSGKGRVICDIRRYYIDANDGRSKPTKQGVMVEPAEAKHLQDALSTALAQSAFKNGEAPQPAVQADGKAGPSMRQPARDMDKETREADEPQNGSGRRPTKKRVIKKAAATASKRRVVRR